MSYVKIEFTFGCEVDSKGGAITVTQEQAAIRLIKKEAAQIFGAYTLFPTYGGWKNSKDRLIEERGYTLFVVVEVDDFVPTGRTHELVDSIKSALLQESVAVTTAPVTFGLL